MAPDPIAAASAADAAYHAAVRALVARHDARSWRGGVLCGVAATVLVGLVACAITGHGRVFDAIDAAAPVTP